MLTTSSPPGRVHPDPELPDRPRLPQHCQPDHHREQEGQRHGVQLWGQQPGTVPLCGPEDQLHSVLWAWPGPAVPEQGRARGPGDYRSNRQGWRQTSGEARLWQTYDLSWIKTNVIKTSLLRRLQAQTLPDEAPPMDKIHPFSKIAVTFEPELQFRCPSRIS